MKKNIIKICSIFASIMAIPVLFSCDSNSSSKGENSEHQHVWDKGTVSKEATCQETGTMKYTCNGCSETKTETIGKTSHTEVVDAAVAATCTTTGLTEGKHCSVCDEVLVKQDEVPMLSHDFVNDVCSVCSYEKYTAGLSFTLNDTETGYSVSGYTGEEKDVVIPNTFEGKPVVAIGIHAFENDKHIETIRIPNSVTEIKEYSFYTCENLSSITIPDGVTSIGSSAFYKCSSLEAIDIPSSVKRIGSDAFASCSALKSVKMHNGVTTIDSGAFLNCGLLTSIEIPKTVSYIGTRILKDCDKLEELSVPFIGDKFEDNQYGNLGYFFGDDRWYSQHESIPETLKEVSVTNAKIIEGSAFYKCSNIETITLNEGLVSIESNTFYNCSSLKSIVIPSSVTNINTSTGAPFAGCNSLISITLPYGDIIETSTGDYFGRLFGGSWYQDNADVVPETLKEVTVTKGQISSYAFYGCSSINKVTILDGVSIIYNDAFNGCSSLTSVTIPNSVTSIGSSAFQDCSSLESITIPNNVTCIENNAFNGCNNLSNVTFEENSKLEIIENSAFSGCSDLTSIEIPSSVTNIGQSTFSGCVSLKSMTLPFVGGDVSAETASSSTLFGYIFGTTQYTGGTLINQRYSSSFNTEYCIPNLLKEVTITGGNILYGAFYNCSGLESIVAPNNITKISEYAFYNCISLKSFTIPEDVESIGNYAFNYCEGLESIAIPNKVKSIGNSAFSMCNSLESITMSNSVESIGGSAFVGCSNLISITIPSSVATMGGYVFSGCNSLTIYCEAASKPSGWNSNWNAFDVPVVWNSNN